jgi:prophage regulatory protein
MSHPLKLCTQKELKTVYGIPYCRQHLRRMEEAKKFPQRIKLGTFRIGYRCSEIERWLENPTG